MFLPKGFANITLLCPFQLRIALSGKLNPCPSILFCFFDFLVTLLTCALTWHTLILWFISNLWKRNEKKENLKKKNHPHLISRDKKEEEKLKNTVKCTINVILNAIISYE